jgi:hypothetical protein
MTAEEMKRMVLEQSVQETIDTLKEWAKSCTGEPTKETRTLLTFHVNKLANAYDDLRKQAAQRRLDALNADATATSNEKGSEIRVSIMGSEEAFDVANVYVTTNEGHVFVGSVYQGNDDGQGPVFLTPQFRAELTFDELRGMMDYVEKHRGQVPVQRSSAFS